MTPIPPNGTHAKDVAFHFLSMTGVERATPQVIARTIAQTKRLMQKGYTKEQICAAIDKAIEKGIQMYSIGYIATSIDILLKEIESDRLRHEGEMLRAQMEVAITQQREAVTNDDASAERNRQKASQFGVQSRLRKKFNFDMFEK